MATQELSTYLDSLDYKTLLSTVTTSSGKYGFLACNPQLQTVVFEDPAWEYLPVEVQDTLVRLFDKIAEDILSKPQFNSYLTRGEAKKLARSISAAYCDELYDQQSTVLSNDVMLYTYAENASMSSLCNQLLQQFTLTFTTQSSSLQKLAALIAIHTYAHTTGDLMQQNREKMQELILACQQSRILLAKKVWKLMRILGVLSIPASIMLIIIGLGPCTLPIFIVLSLCQLFDSYLKHAKTNQYHMSITDFILHEKHKISWLVATIACAALLMTGVYFPITFPVYIILSVYVFYICSHKQVTDNDTPLITTTRPVLSSNQTFFATTTSRADASQNNSNGYRECEPSAPSSHLLQEDSSWQLYPSPQNNSPPIACLLVYLSPNNSISNSLC